MKLIILFITFIVGVFLNYLLKDLNNYIFLFTFLLLVFLLIRHTERDISMIKSLIIFALLLYGINSLLYFMFNIKHANLLIFLAFFINIIIMLYIVISFIKLKDLLKIKPFNLNIFGLNLFNVDMLFLYVLFKNNSYNIKEYTFLIKNCQYNETNFIEQTYQDKIKNLIQYKLFLLICLIRHLLHYSYIEYLKLKNIFLLKRKR